MRARACTAPNNNNDNNNKHTHKQVVWADQWWRKTARVVDHAIDRAVQVRDTNTKRLTAADRARRTDEVSAVLWALTQQQHVAAQASAGSERLIREQKQKEGDARRKKRSQEAASLAAGSMGDSVEAQQLLVLNGNDGGAQAMHTARAVARLKELTVLFDGGSVAATFAQVQSALGLGPPPKLGSSSSSLSLSSLSSSSSTTTSIAVTAAGLENPSFELVHGLVVQLLQHTEYMQGSFSAVEFNAQSRYMGYPINRANFVNKVVQAVANDLGLPPGFVSAKHVVGDPAPQPSAARLFLCLLAQAAAPAAARGSVAVQQ